MNRLAPYCPLPITNQARAYEPACSTDIAKRFAEYSLADEYQQEQLETAACEHQEKTNPLYK